MSFAQKIRERRKELGLTQSQLAEMIHVSRQTVSHWETDRVQPDAEALLLLAEALECSFTIGGEDSAEKASAADVAPEASADAAEALGASERPPRRKKRLLWIAAATLVVVIALAAALVLALRPPEMAEIIVTPQDGEAYLIYNDRFGSGGGWDIPFTFENVSDVPFRIERIECRFYEDDMLWNVIYVTMDQIMSHVSSEWMRKGDFPLRWPVGTDQLYLTHIECTIHGTDANGNVLRFSSRVRLLPAEE